MNIGTDSERSLSETLALYSRLAAARRRLKQAQGADLAQATTHKRVSAELRNIDGAVKAHEQTHVALAGPYASSAASYITVRGPDGRSYAVGGAVKVDLRPVPGNPEATLRKARAIIRAAYGPHQPSAADMRVAAQAYRLEQQARAEIKTEASEQRPHRDPPAAQAEVDILV